jgi:Ca-activated chloride channel family protein
MNQSMTMTLTPGYEAISSHHASKLPVLIHIEASEHNNSTTERAPITLELCIDHSGSMQGEPLSLVKHAAKLVLEQLKPFDRVGLVSFADNAHQWASVEPLSDGHRKHLLQAIEQLDVDGWTAMYAGLQTSLQNMPATRPDEVSRVLLLTDGFPNVGPSSTKELADMTAEWKRHNVVSTFGFGENHNEDMLQDIAKAGGGHYTYIDNVESVPTAFAMELGALFSTVARDARLYIQPSPHCTIGKIYGDHELRYTTKGLEIQLSDWIAGQSLELLLELEITPESRWNDVMDCLSVGLHYFSPEQEERIEQSTQLTMPTTPQMPTTLHRDITRHQLLMDVARCWKEAQSLAGRGQYMDAVALIDPWLQTLAQHPDWLDETSQVRDWYEQFVDEKELFLTRPSQSHYQAFRKQAVADMALPGQAMGGAAMASRLAGSAAQRHMIEQFQPVDGNTAHLEVWERNQLQQVIPITHELTIGRMQGNDIVIPKGNVSKRHARIIPTNQGFVLSDMKSTNGLYINGNRLHEPHTLREGDTIHIGDLCMNFREAPQA